MPYSFYLHTIHSLTLCFPPKSLPWLELGWLGWLRTLVRSLKACGLCHELEGAVSVKAVPNSALACVLLLGGLGSLLCLFAGGGVSCPPSLSRSLLIRCSNGLSFATSALPVLAGVTMLLSGLAGPLD